MQDIHGLTATMKDSPRKEAKIALLPFHLIQDVIQQKPILMNTIKAYLPDYMYGYGYRLM
ncbi:MAG: hypothetical protein OIN87_00850 [Candidatus Methanoperedens sp.]|nr:hypothetical protein [Candidatus Methanoperedens sp.]